MVTVRPVHKLICVMPDEDIWVKPRKQNQLSVDSEITLGYIQPVVVKTYFWW